MRHPSMPPKSLTTPTPPRAATRRAATALLAAASCLALSLPAGTATAQERTQFSIAWSIYVGWMPWGYADEAGIVDRWAERYGIEIEVVQINDYIESINQYTAGAFDGCVMTNMDALTIPAGGRRRLHGADRRRLLQRQRRHRGQVAARHC